MRNKYVQELKTLELKGNKTCIRAFWTIHSKVKVLFLSFSLALIFLKLLLGQVNDWPLREPHTSLCSLAVRILQRLETFEGENRIKLLYEVRRRWWSMGAEEWVSQDALPLPPPAGIYFLYCKVTWWRWLTVSDCCQINFPQAVIESIQC